MLFDLICGGFTIYFINKQIFANINIKQIQYKQVSADNKQTQAIQIK